MGSRGQSFQEGNSMTKSINGSASWKLVSWRTALLAAFVLYTLIGFFVVPWVAEKVIQKVAREKLDREVTIEKIRCNPFTLSLTVEGLDLPDRPGSTMLSFDEMYANLQASSLFRWAFTLKEIDIQNPYFAMRRFEDGGINVLEVRDDLGETVDFSDEAFGLPRALLQEIRITGGRVELEDRAREEPLVWELGPAELSMHEISTIPDEQGTDDISIGLPEGGTIQITGSVVVEPFGVEGALSMDQAVVGNLWTAVGHKFDFDVQGGTLSTDLLYRLWLGEEGLGMQVRDLAARVTDVSVSTLDSDEELLQVPSVVVAGGSLLWPEAQLEAESVVVESPSASVWLESDGTPVWKTLVPEETRQELIHLWEELEEKYSPVAVVHRFEVGGAGAAFEDRTFEEPMRVEVSDAAVVIADISSEPGTRWGLEASAALAGGAPASATGTLMARPLTVDAEVGVADLDLAQFQPYIAKLVPLDLLAGQLTATGTAHVEPRDDAPDLTFEGSAKISSLDLVETVTDSALLKWGELQVEGIQAALLPTSAEVAQVDINEAGLEIVVAEDGTINVLEFFRAIAEDLENLPPAHVAKVELHDCFGRYLEENPTRPFELSLEAVNGTVLGFATDATTNAELEVDAAISSGGVARVTGELDPFDYDRLTDMEVDVRDVHLPPMSAKSLKIVGHPVDEGAASLTLDVAITDQQLVSANHVEISNLQLGERVEGDRVIDLPVKLGVKLLKDKNGQIILDIPVEADMSNPEFVMTAAFTSAFQEIVGEIAKSPFKMLGRLAGGSDDQDLEFVDFAAGSAELETRVTTNLDTLAKALAERPTLILEIAGTVDPELDASGLRRAALEGQLASEGVGIAELETGDLGRLETMVKNQAAGSDLDALRAQFTTGTEESTLDEAAYRTALVDELIAAQGIDEAEAQSLAANRAQAIRAYLVDQAGVDASRVVVLTETATVTDSDQWVRCQLSLQEG
jgi:hypothetical protein